MCNTMLDTPKKLEWSPMRSDNLSIDDRNESSSKLSITNDQFNEQIFAISVKTKLG